MKAAYGVVDPAGVSLRLLDGLFGGADVKGVGVRLWDGTRWPDDGARTATIVLKHPGSLREMFLPGTELGLAEAYIQDDFDVEGDMEAAFEAYELLVNAASRLGGKLKAACNLRMLPSGAAGRYRCAKRAEIKGMRHSPDRDTQAVRYHYDVSNDYYALWLDSRMIYSCAYFNSLDESLDTAQQRKLDYICRKLRLRAGQRLLDIGCGWGGLVMHAAANYGVDATGITLSGAQAEMATRRIHEAGLSDRCRVKLTDYREVQSDRQFDALVSIGMFEHVGSAVLPAYFENAYRLLASGGVFLNHGIARRADEIPSGKEGFIDTYVFPDGELVPINEAISAAEWAGFEVRDVESLREHYTMTLRHWVRNLEDNREKAATLVGEPTYRVWRLYMSGSAHWFRTGKNNVYQTLLSKPLECGSSCLPLTRSDWY